jgi:periplasmic protein CpxP/Spy
MQLKKLSILASIVVIGLSTTSFTTKAEARRSNPLLVAQEQPARQPRGRFEDKLGLTDAQKADMQAIKKRTQEKIDAILTPEQRAQKQAAQQNRQPGNRQAGKRGGWKALNLTESQKNDIKKVMEASKAEMQNVLTPEQKAQWEQMRQEKRSRRQQAPRPNNSPS